MIGWLLVAVFGIIWAAFLLPSWRRNPTTTVEEFEQKMSLLAEAHKASPGRWVLVPRKGHRFLGPQDRQRARMRRRRRFLFVALLDLMGLTFLMGLFQPLRAMWIATALLAGLLVVYVGFLLRLRSVERSRAAGRRALAAARRRSAYADGYGNGLAYGSGFANGNGHPGSAHPNGNGVRARAGNGHVRSVGNGHSAYPNGNGKVSPEVDPRLLGETVVQFIDEDVHVIVRRSDEMDLQALRATRAVPNE